MAHAHLNRFYFLSALLFALGAGTAASAEEKIDPTQIRVITPTGATSKCFGEATTPMCAIETLIGCANYVWNKGCEAAGRPLSPDRRPNIRIEYVIVKAGLVNPEKVRAARAEDMPGGDLGSLPWLSEDAFQAILFERSCPATKKDCLGERWRDSMLTVSPSSRYPGNWSSASIAVYNSQEWFVD